MNHVTGCIITHCIYFIIRFISVLGGVIWWDFRGTQDIHCYVCVLGCSIYNSDVRFILSKLREESAAFCRFQMF